MLTELIELGRKMKEQMKDTPNERKGRNCNWITTKNKKKKDTPNEIKQNIQGTNSDRKETGTQINSLDQKEEIKIQPEQNEETRIQKYEERLKNLQDNFKCSNIQIIGVPGGGEEEQEVENLFEKTLKGNFPNLARK